MLLYWSEVILTYGNRLHVLVALGMVYHDKVLILSVVLYLHVSFSRILQSLRKGIHILLVIHVTYFVSCCLNVYCLTQFFLNRTWYFASKILCVRQVELIMCFLSHGLSFLKILGSRRCEGYFIYTVHALYAPTLT